MKTIKTLTVMIVAMLLLFSGSAVWATNIQFSAGPVIHERNIQDNTIVVRFSVGWDNSWNLNSPPNHDAAWIFMKYRQLGQEGFRHANLHQVDDIVRGSGSTPHNQDYGTSSLPNGTEATVGVFLSRRDISVGRNDFNNVELHWDIRHTGITDASVISVRVFAIEMVYIPGGQFHSRHADPETGVPVMNGDFVDLDDQSWPIGLNPFYIMKHEVTQHAWVDFLNTLTLQQQRTLSWVDPTSPAGTSFAMDRTEGGNLTGSRMNIRIRHSAEQNRPAVFGLNVGAPGASAWDPENQGGTVPMFGLRWSDVMAYLDWAGLRPLTELEYEKAARGPLDTVANEFAWGNSHLGTPGGGVVNRDLATEIGPTEANRSTPNLVDANPQAVNNSDVSWRWPIRAGAFARAATSRVEAGASFWGVMNMSDNVPERFVSFSHEEGRRFRGSHGDGNLTGDGFADVSDWPSVAQRTFSNTAGAEGTIFRGIGLTNATTIPAWTGANHGVSSRLNASVHGIRDPWSGARGGRSMTAGFIILTQPSTRQRSMLADGQAGTDTEWPDIGFTVGGLGHTIQWYRTDDPNNLDAGVQIPGATQMRFMPPSDVAHGARYFFARVTNSDGETLTTNLSGAHFAMAVSTHPSTNDVQVTFGTPITPLVAAINGGVGPFTVTWLASADGTPGEPGGAEGIAFRTLENVSQEDLAEALTLREPPMIFVFSTWVSITDNDNTTIRTNLSGVHTGSVPHGIIAVGGIFQRVGPAATVGTAPPAGRIDTIGLTPGLYRLEAWGASGGGHICGNLTAAIGASHRWGGYTRAYMRITEPTVVFAAAGGQGTNTRVSQGTIAGGWNGGGIGRNSAAHIGGSGGGASHISLASGLLTNTTVRTTGANGNILIVAGGAGGGGCGWSGWANRLEPHGGGTPASVNSWGEGGGPGTATAGGAVRGTGTAGTAGQGGNAATGTQPGSGGGGGWFGGGAGSSSSCTSFGGGGSGFVNTARLPNITGRAGNMTGRFITAASAATTFVAPAGQTQAQLDGGGAQVPISPAGVANASTPRPGAIRITRVE